MATTSNNKDKTKKEEYSKNILEDKILQGRCKWFNRAKGYGFITLVNKDLDTHSDGQIPSEVFFYYTAIQMEGYRILHSDQLVRFKVHQGSKGLEAYWIEPLDQGSSTIKQQDVATITRKKLIKCYNCGKFGHHRAAKCNIDSAALTTEPKEQTTTTTRSEVKELEPCYKKRCFKCRSNQHLEADCPLKQ